MGGFGGWFQGGCEGFSFWWDREKILFQGPLEIFFNQELLKNFSVKVRLKIFREGSGREISGQIPPVPAKARGLAGSHGRRCSRGMVRWMKLINSLVCH